MKVRSPIDLSDLSIRNMIEELDAIVFTAARDWKRSVRINKETRDHLVAALSLYQRGDRQPVERQANANSK